MAKNIKELLKQTRQRRKAEITLSTGVSFEMYFLPLTEAEDDKIRDSVANDKSVNAYAISVLVNKAEYEDGEKMFSIADKGAIRQEYAKSDITQMIMVLLDNGGVLAMADPKSTKGSDQE
jgi:hypothetical protein